MGEGFVFKPAKQCFTKQSHLKVPLIAVPELLIESHGHPQQMVCLLRMEL